MNNYLLTMAIMVITSKALAQESHRRWHQREAFQTDLPMVHDPVMAKEGDTYYIYATGMGIQQMTSKDRKTWTVLPQPTMTVTTTLSIPSTGRISLSATAIVPHVMERLCSSSIQSAGRQMDGQKSIKRAQTNNELRIVEIEFTHY